MNPTMSGQTTSAPSFSSTRTILLFAIGEYLTRISPTMATRGFFSAVNGMLSKTADRKPVKNAELWVRLDALRELHEVHWRWVKGHSGDAGNERADALANRGAAAYG